VETVEIARRFRGPASSGNGGYTCGLLSRLVDGDAEVTLRMPPPLDTPLRVEQLQVFDGDALVAEVRPATVELELPAPVAYADAVALQPPPDPEHPFPECFVCGPQGDGLRLRPGPVGDGRVVAPWVPEEVSPELVWAALDCPGAFAVNPHFERGPTVLGRLAAHVERLPAVGDELVVVAWDLGGGDGRRFHAGTALFGGDEPLAWARAVWFRLGSAA
jgi:hypothetical protein